MSTRVSGLLTAFSFVSLSLWLVWSLQGFLKDLVLCMLRSDLSPYLFLLWLQ